MDKILTIIIPTYNMEKYLRHCLDSLIVPNMDKVEVLVINDGSKDSSSAIGHEYQDKYPQTFRVIDKENGNYGSCVNRGLKEATGKYVKVLDADDSFENDNFNLFIDQLEKNDYDVILTDYSEVNEEGLVNNKIILNLPSRTKLTLKQLTNKYRTGFVMHCATYRTELVRIIHYTQPEGVSYTDQIWMQEPFAYIKSAIYIPLNVYLYLVGREGQTMDPKVVNKDMHSHIVCALSMLERTVKFPNENEVGKEFMFNKALHTIVTIYDTFLFKKGLNLTNLKDFDSSIKSIDNYMYDYLDKIVFNKLFPYHFIKAWRRNPNSYLSTYVKLLHSLCNSKVILAKLHHSIFDK